MEVRHRNLTQLVIEVDFDVSGVSHSDLLQYLRTSGISVVDLQFTQNSVAVFLSSPVPSGRIQDLLADYVVDPDESPLSVLEVPVCYEYPYAPDLPVVCDVLALDPQQVIEQHQSATYDVAMFGFVPGFAYLQGLPKTLYIDRKDTPVKKLDGGSVAIAANYSAVYPVDAPGGWHVIGRTPLKIVNWHSKDPFLFSFESIIKFVSISSEEFQSYAN